MPKNTFPVEKPNILLSNILCFVFLSDVCSRFYLNDLTYATDPPHFDDDDDDDDDFDRN